MVFDDRTIAKRVDNLPSLKLALGTNLTKRIDNLTNRNLGCGMLVGSIVGAVISAIVLPRFSQNPDISIEATRAYFAFFGATYGAGLGAPLGGLLGSYKLKRLEKEFPEQAEYIREYDSIRRVANSICARGN